MRTPSEERAPARRIAATLSKGGRAPYLSRMTEPAATPVHAPVLDPEDCTDMTEVRAGVDAVDRALVALLARRQGYMGAAARIKPRAEDVRVPWRIEEVVQNVLAQAETEGLSARIAEPVWRELIERSIAYEAERWQALRAEGAPKGSAEQVLT